MNNWLKITADQITTNQILHLQSAVPGGCSFCKSETLQSALEVPQKLHIKQMLILNMVAARTYSTRKSSDSWAAKYGLLLVFNGST